MQTIVITGSTRGIGKGLAREFLKLGHRMVVTGRSQAAVDSAVAELASPDAVLGCVCDVRDMAALAGMLRQGGGKIYTFEGFGSNGMMSPGLTTYGSSKYGLRYFTRSLAREYKDSPVLIGAQSPGMVPTDVLLYSSKSKDEAEWAKAKRVMNILGDTVETVTPWLA